MSEEAFFIGYGQNYYGYRLQNDETKETFRANNVTFLESKLYKEKENCSTTKSKGYVDLEAAQNEVQTEYQ